MTDAERSSSPNESQFEQWLAKSVYRVTCPDTLQLGEYAEGMLSGAELTQVETHVETCPKCRQELQFLRTFMDVEIVPEVKKSQLDSLIDKLQGSIRRLIALLQPPNVPGFGGQMAAGALSLRGTVGDQLVYAVDDVQIVIDIQRDPEDQNLRVIYGLVLGLEEEQPVAITLQSAEQPIADTILDDIGNFSFDGLAKGEYQVYLKAESVEVEINELKIE